MMVTKEKQAPVADSTNGTLLHVLEPCSHCCHLPPPADAPPPAPLGRHGDGEDTVGPLVLTLGSAVADNGHAVPCRCSCSRDAAVPASAPVTMSVLRGSRYLRPAQELLRAAVSVGGEVADAGARGSDDEAKRHGQLEAGDAHQEMNLHGKSDDGGGGVQAKLLSLLNELESRQEHYFQELGRVASSFELVLGAAATAGYTSLMAQAMSRHFGNLRRAILRKLRLHAARRPASSAAALLADEEGDGSDGSDGEDDEDDDDAAQPVTEEMVDRLVRRKKQAAAARAAEQVWRPLRGLPEDSVAILRAWLFDHFLNPYPNDNEKLRLAVRTGLSRRQISNWFINARVRLWKPMVEEMYNDEFSEDSVSIGGGAASSSS